MLDTQKSLLYKHTKAEQQLKKKISEKKKEITIAIKYTKNRELSDRHLEYYNNI